MCFKRVDAHDMIYPFYVYCVIYPTMSPLHSSPFFVIKKYFAMLTRSLIIMEDFGSN